LLESSPLTCRQWWIIRGGHYYYTENFPKNIQILLNILITLSHFRAKKWVICITILNYYLIKYNDHINHGFDQLTGENYVIYVLIPLLIAVINKYVIGSSTTSKHSSLPQIQSAFQCCESFPNKIVEISTDNIEILANQWMANTNIICA
jgi:hypothetical protein